MCITFVLIDKLTTSKGTWCDNCACSNFKPLNEGLVCGHCGHDRTDHCLHPEPRAVLLMVQELAAGGELLGMILNGGPFPEEVARFYFRQLINGVKDLIELKKNKYYEHK